MPETVPFDEIFHIDGDYPPNFWSDDEGDEESPRRPGGSQGAPVKNTAKCRRCGRAVRTVKVRGVRVFAAHNDVGTMCPGAGERVNRP